jgi:hypothetical protein
VLKHTRDIHSLSSLMRLLSSSPTPISAVSKLGRMLEVPDRWVTSFLRYFPTTFVESVGPLHNFPRFRLSAAAARLLRKEQNVFAARCIDVTSRMCRYRYPEYRVPPRTSFKPRQQHLPPG